MSIVIMNGNTCKGVGDAVTGNSVPSENLRNSQSFPNVRYTTTRDLSENEKTSAAARTSQVVEAKKAALAIEQPALGFGRKPADDRQRLRVELVGSRLATAAGLIASLLALIGIFTQFVAYIIAASYFRSFGIEPADAGITPINAAYRLNNTFVTLLASGIVEYGFWLAIPCVVFLAIRRFRTSQRTLAEEAERDASRALLRPGNDAVVQERLTRYISMKDWASKYRRRSSYSTIELLRETIYVAAPVIILFAILFFIIQTFIDVRALGSAAGNDVIRGRPLNNDVDYVASSLRRDLPAPSVRTEWVEPLKRPTFADTPTLVRSLDAPMVLIVAANGRYFFLLPSEVKVLVVNVSDVRILYAPRQLAPN